MFNYLFRIKTTLLDHFGAKKVLYRLDLCKTSYKDLVFVRSEFLMFIGDPNGSLRLIIIYYMFKCEFGVQTTLLVSLRRENSLLKARFRQN